MNNKRKYTRPTPPREPFGARNDEPCDWTPDPAEDKELKALLEYWKAPEASGALDRRLLNAYRQRVVALPLWRRVLTKTIPVPLPVAAAAAIVLLSISATLALRTPHPSPGVSSSRPTEPSRVVEVPVVQERVVTRVVYVERKQQPSRVEARRQPPALKRTDPERAAARGSEETEHFTRVDLAGFQPAGEMKIRVLKRSDPDEN